MIALVLLLARLVSSLSNSSNEDYEFLGCWRGEAKRHIGLASDKNELVFGPVFKKSAIALAEAAICKSAAAERGIQMFIVTKDGCRGDAHTGLKFQKYGRSDSCKRSEHDANIGHAYARGGIYNKEIHNEENALFYSKKKAVSKKERIFKKPIPKLHPEIIRKDIILMNKVFKRVYGDDYKSNAGSRFMKAFPDIDHFNSYYGDEADTYESEKGKDKSEEKPKNLFENPGFEEPLLHNTWNCLGELNHGTGGIMSRTVKYKRSGRYAGVCHSRIGAWAGPGQFTGHVVKPGHAYRISGWTQLLNCSDNDLDKIELWIRYQGKEVKNHTETRIILAKRDKYNENKGWQEWNAQFFLPKHKQGFRYVQILFKGPKHHVDIVIDDMVLEELPLEEGWLQEVKVRTEELRKRDTVIRLKFDSAIVTPEQLAAIKVKVSQKRHFFGFGSAVNHSPLKKEKKYRDFFMQNFDWGVPESAMKWNIMEAKKGNHVHKLMDDFVDTLKHFNISMRGHCIFWEVDTESPKWLNKMEKEDIAEELKKRIEDTVGTYKERISHWDVNNEMLHGTFFADKLGPEIRDWMYKTVHDEDPSSKLFLNDFDVVANGIYTQSYLEQIDGFKKRKAPIHGIGVQGHFLGWTHPAIIQERLDILAKAGLPIWITELDILERNETKRARALEHVMRVAFGHESVDGIILWAFWSSAAWRGADTALIDDDFNLNEVGKLYLELRKEWTTKEMLKPSSILDSSCEFKFRGYHGTYDIEVLFPDGQVISNEIDLHPKRRPLLIEINTHVND